MTSRTARTPFRPGEPRRPAGDGSWQKIVGGDGSRGRRRPPALAAIEQSGGPELDHKIALPAREVWDEKVDLLDFGD